MPLRMREITRWVMYIYHYTFLARIKSVLISSGNYIFKLQWLQFYTFIRRGIIVCWLSPYENNIQLITIYNRYKRLLSSDISFMRSLGSWSGNSQLKIVVKHDIVPKVCFFNFRFWFKSEESFDKVEVSLKPFFISWRWYCSVFSPSNIIFYHLLGREIITLFNTTIITSITNVDMA